MLLPGLLHFFHAWWDLDTERHIYEWGIGPIPWSAIRRYGRSIGYRARDLDYFVDVMRRVDTKHRSKEAEKRTGGASTSNKIQVPSADGQAGQKRPKNRTRRRNA